ncbi:MAG: riboflavin biosynthesis protein RibF [Elusimicrobiota bacterium]|jgi:riboflavin kinase/FMN adenylyltransferase
MTISMNARNLVTLGTFDGLHRGHRRVLKALRAQARRLGLRTLAVVFDVPPRSVLQGVAAQLLSTPEERERLLRAAGVESVRILRFSGGLARTSHQRFFSDFLIKRCRAAGILVGPDFAFGRGRRGDVHWLREACREKGLHFSTPPLLTARGGREKVSSSHIRTLLSHGRVEDAARLLGRPYCVRGRVVRGLGLGARIGLPTANIETDARRVLPRGVYAVRAKVGRRLLPAVCNVGVQPTLGGEGRLTVEVHIPRFSGPLYGRILEIRFERFLRGERRFPSLRALVRSIRLDVSQALRLLDA